jgi:hypothetical protein
VFSLSISSILSFSLRSSDSCLRLLPRLPITSVLSYTFSSIMCSRRQFPRRMRPIQLVFLLVIVCRMSLSFMTLFHISFSNMSVQLSVFRHSSPALHLKTCQVFLICFPKCPSFSAIQIHARFFHKFKSNLLVKRVFYIILHTYINSFLCNMKVAALISLRGLPLTCKEVIIPSQLDQTHEI